MNLKHSCRSIAIAGHRGDTATVLDALDADDGELRVTALGAAARLGVLDKERLLHAIGDPDPSVRARALDLSPRVELPETERQGVAATIVTLLASEPDREAAAFALGELEVVSPAIESGLRALASNQDDPLSRESAVAALGALGVGLETILAALDDVATVRRRAVIALASFDGPAVDEALERALTDRDWQVRQAAEDLAAISASAEDADTDGDDGPGEGR